MNENEPISVDLQWPDGKLILTFLIGPLFGVDEEYPVEIAVAGGDFRGVGTSDLLGLPCFLTDLERLYETLNGEARLVGYDERCFAVILRARERGRIDIEVRIASDPDGQPDETLTVRRQIDQTYLPPMIAAVRRAVRAAGADTSEVVAPRLRMRSIDPKLLALIVGLTVFLSVVVWRELATLQPDTLFLARAVGGYLTVCLLVGAGQYELLRGR